MDFTKMKTVYYIYLLLFALIVTSCEDKNSYILQGNIKGLESPELYLLSGDGLHVDTIRTKSGKFTYRGVSQTVEPLLIYMENTNVWVTIWVQNGEKYALTGDADCPEMMMVKGGETNKLLSEFKTANQSQLKEKCELRNKLSVRSEQAMESGMNINNSQLSSQLKNVDRILKTRAQDFVEAHPSSIAALVLIQDYILDIENACNIQPFLNLLTDEVKANALYEKLNTRCLKDIQIKADHPALNFKLTDTNNDTISLETFKDKYLILSFASSRCELCKPEYAELLSIQKTFPEKELTILTISLDENKEDWKKTAKEYGINWTQVIDSAGWSSETVSLYNVLTIPCNYLIDKSGIIIGSKLRPDSIQSILKSKLKIQKTKNS